MPVWDDDLAAAGYKLRLNIVQSSQNVGANTSVISWSLQLVKGSGSGKSAGGPHFWSVLIDGQYRDGSIGSYDFGQYALLTLGEGQMTIGHDPDGKKTVVGQAGFDDNNSYGEIGDGQVGPGPLITLTTIPRASDPSFSASAVDAGDPITINTNRASSGFTHTVKYKIGSASGTIATGVGASTSWTPPLSLLSQIPNATSGALTVTLDTYSGSTKIGSSSSTFTLRAGSGVVPDFASISHSDAVALVSTQVGAYVKGMSKLTLGIGGAVGAYGSTITGYKIVAAGQTINAVSGTMSSPINASGTVVVTGTITDSRGRTRTKTINVTVLAWAPPTITGFVLRRAAVGGTPQVDGTTIRADLTAAVSSLINGTEKNSLTYRMWVRERGATTWSSAVAPTTPAGVAFSGMLLASAYAVDKSWEVRIDVTDKFATTTIQGTVATAAIEVHFDKGVGVGIQKFREKGALDVGGLIYELGGLVSPVGLMTPYAGATAPDGWLICDGAAVSRVTYDRLFAVIGTTYGSGNGTTTFNLPNMKGRVAVGLDAAQTEFNVRGETGGAKDHTLTVAEMPSHAHTQAAHTHSYNTFAKDWAIGSGQSGNGRGMDNSTSQGSTTGSATPTINATGGGGAHNNLQPYMALPYIIRI